MDRLPDPRVIQDSLDEIETSLWRVQEAIDNSAHHDENEFFSDAASEINDLLKDATPAVRLALVDRMIAHLEQLEGLDESLVAQALVMSRVSRSELDAYRLDQSTPTAHPHPRTRL